MQLACRASRLLTLLNAFTSLTEMARRPDTESDESQKGEREVTENNVTNEDIKSLKKKAKMSVDEHDAEGSSQQAQLNGDSKGEGDGEDEDEDEDEDALPKSRKRTRIDEDGGSVNGEAEEDTQPAPTFKARREKLPRDKDGCVKCPN